MNNLKKILISIGISSLLTLIIGYFIFKLPDWFFPTNYKIIILIITFISLTLSNFLFFVQIYILRTQFIDDKKKGLRRSNFLIAFIIMTLIWSILIGLSIYDNPNQTVHYLTEYAIYLPLGILGLYIWISLIRKEKYLTKTNIVKDKELKKDSSVVGSSENVCGVIITEGGYPAHGYDLVFTDQRLIIVDAGPTIGGLHVKKGDKKSLQYQGLSPEQILSNFNCKWVYYRDIIEANLNKGMLNSFVIKAPTFSSKYYFKKYQYQSAEDLFNKFLFLKSSSTN
jgi:hypothetical protein